MQSGDGCICRQDLLREFEMTSGAMWWSFLAGAAMKANERAMVLWLVRAGLRSTMLSARELMPLLDKDSRAAIWVLVEIYSRLLRTGGCAARGCVQRAGVSVPTAEKMWMLALVRGGAMARRDVGA